MYFALANFDRTYCGLMWGQFAVDQGTYGLLKTQLYAMQYWNMDYFSNKQIANKLCTNLQREVELSPVLVILYEI